MLAWPSRGRRRISETRWGNAVDPALVTPASQVDVLDDIERNVNGLDDRATHVEDVEGAVRCIDKIDRSEPVVRRSDELR